MTETSTYLKDRRAEFDAHYNLVVAFEESILSGVNLTIGSIKVSTYHLLAMKSGLIIHLYNIVEATMSGVIKLVGHAVGTVPPRDWSEPALREWLRENAVERVDGSADARLASLHKIYLRLLGDAALGPQGLKKPTGTWTDHNIRKFAKRLGVEFKIPGEMWLRIGSTPELGDRSPLAFLAERRNALAHGRRSFEKGANDIVLQRLREIADTTLDFLELAASAFQNYVDGHHYKTKFVSK